MNRVAAISVGWLGIALLGAGVFLPWQTIEWDYRASFGGQILDFESDSHGTAWGERAVGKLNGEEEKDSGSWLGGADESIEEMGYEIKGMTWLRVSAVIFILGSLTGLTGAIMTSAMAARAGPIILTCAAGLALLMFAAFMIGHAGYYESVQEIDEDLAREAQQMGASYRSDTGHPVGAGLFMAIAGILALATAGILGLVARRPAGARTPFAGSGYATSSAYSAPAAAYADGHTHSPFAAATRKLKCPKCKAINAVPTGAKPSCSSCGFGT